VNRSAITQAKNKGTVPESWIWKLARTFHLDLDWIEPSETEPQETFEPEKSQEQDTVDPEFQKIPKVKARLCAGGGSFEVDPVIEGYYAFRSDWLYRKGNPQAMVLMDVMGDSMEPLIEEGDTVLIDQSQQDILAGKIYAVGVDDTVMVKRIEKHPGKLVLISTNPRYTPLYLQGEEIETIRVIGAILWVCRELV
jgi:phage repressor protein C with HTH and peptisase S24 domain